MVDFNSALAQVSPESKFPKARSWFDLPLDHQKQIVHKYMHIRFVYTPEFFNEMQVIMREPVLPSMLVKTSDHEAKLLGYMNKYQQSKPNAKEKKASRPKALLSPARPTIESLRRSSRMVKKRDFLGESVSHEEMLESYKWERRAKFVGDSGKKRQVCTCD